MKLATDTHNPFDHDLGYEDELLPISSIKHAEELLGVRVRLWDVRREGIEGFALDY